jgi:hypothetical protein
MRFLVLIWFAVEVVQIVVIGMLVVGYRNLQRKVEGDHRFVTSPPRSVTED